MSALTFFPSLASLAGGALIASPSTAFRERVLDRLNGRCRPVQQALGGADALAQLEMGDWQVLFLDRRISDLETGELIGIIQKRFPGTQVVLLDSGSGFHDSDGEGVSQSGAVPGAPVAAVSAEVWRLGGEAARTGKAANFKDAAPLPGMIGGSEAMQRLYRLARLAAPRTTTILVAGPTGSGKELVAKALHSLSPRAGRPFIAVNCAAIPEALLESELFGHARGAFTGAAQAQIGRIPAAHGGTLFLDEISELPLGMQAKLLRFLEEKEVQRLGAPEASRVDVRVIAASNADLAARTVRCQFREDLLYRLSAFPLEVPPLSERREDIVPLAEHFLECVATTNGLCCPQLSGEAAAILENHSWRGNVRELQHVIERASILAEGEETVRAEHLYFPFRQPQPPASTRGLSCASLAS